MNTLHQGLIYGLKVAAPFALPGPAYAGPPDVVIEEDVCPDYLEDALEVNAYLQINAQACLTRVPAMGSVLIERSGRIVIDCPQNMPQAWKLTLALGSGLGSYLHMIGRIPLHGMAWVTNGSATLVLGRSGTGKSTLAAAMLHCGHTLLSDDVIPVGYDQGNSPIAYPAHQRFKLSPNLLGTLGIDIQPLTQVLPESDKLAWCIPDSAFHAEPVSVSRCIILLPSRSNTAQVELQPLTGLNALHRLKRQVYRPQLITRLGHQNQLFALTHQLATKATIEVCQLPDLSSFDGFTQYAQALEDGFGVPR